MANLWVRPYDGSEEYRLTNFPEDHLIENGKWSPDHRWVATTQSTSVSDIVQLTLRR